MNYASSSGTLTPKQLGMLARAMVEEAARQTAADKVQGAVGSLIQLVSQKVRDRW
jgi:hypothetical protein